MVALTGNPDGTSEVDYTVNPATGFPSATGPRNLAEPLNSVLPAWDVAMGTLAAVGLLARRAPPHPHGRGPADPPLALRRRVRDGRQPRPHRRGAARRPRPAQGRQLPLRRVRPRLRDPGRPPRDGRRADRAASGTRCKRRHRHRRGVREHRAGHGPRPRHRDRPLRGPRPDRRAAAAVVRQPRARPRSASASPAPACPGARTRRSASWSPRTRAARPANPMFAEVEHPGDRHLPDARLAAGLLRTCRACPCAGRRGSASTPRRCSPRSSACRAPRSAACTTAAWSPAPPRRRAHEARGIFLHGWRRELHDRQCASTRTRGGARRIPDRRDRR